MCTYVHAHVFVYVPVYIKTFLLETVTLSRVWKTAVFDDGFQSGLL